MENEKPNEERKLSRIAAEAGWHASRYNVVAKVPGSKTIAIYNTYRRTCAEYTPVELYVMGALDEVPEGNPFVARLARRGVIADFDEREAYVAQRRLDSAIPPDSSVQVTICPTLACNFDCPYCFEDHVAGKMTAEVQDDVVGLVERMLDTSGARKLTITWFGGEPLLATDVIDALTPRLMAAAEERGCAYEAWIFTNGYLITPEVVELFGRCKIGYVHVPLDGVGATNDATRRLVGGGPTFERIVANLGLLRPPIQTLLRANVHEGNVRELDELKGIVTTRAKEAGTDLRFYPAAIEDCTSSADEKDSPMAAFAYHGAEVVLRPDSLHIPVGRDHACVGQNLWTVAVDDKGFLYKCGGKLCGKPDFAYGTARTWDPADPLATATWPDMLSRFLNTCAPNPDDACFECVWLPLCGGGCPQLRLFGKPECPAYKRDPEAFVLAKRSRMSR